MLRLFAALALFVALAIPVQAAPVDVTGQISGSSGDWTVSLTFTNNIPAFNRIYFTGVSVDASTIIGSPGGFQGQQQNWDNLAYGGSSIIYNNTWSIFYENGIATGTTLSGFTLHVTTSEAPTILPWFAYGYGGGSVGAESGCFYCGSNPGYEGSVSLAELPIQETPEPASLALLAPALLVLTTRRRRG